jgi:hypothetical protein
VRRQLATSLAGCQGGLPDGTSAWSGGGEHCLAILNLEDRYGEIGLPEPVRGQELLTGKPMSLGPRCQIQKEPLLIQLAD